MIQARASPAKRMLVSMMSKSKYIGMEEKECLIKEPRGSEEINNDDSIKCI